MTDAEAQLLAGLVAARLPLPLQLAVGLALTLGYWAWARAFYARVDPALRAAVGRRLGTRVVWVRRNSAAYETPLQIVRVPYARWGWGIAAEGDRTLARDGAVVLGELVLLRVLTGAVPVVAFLFASLSLRLLSYVVFLPACLVVLTLYAVFWTGRSDVHADG